MAPTTIGLRVDEDLAAALAAEADRTGASISDLVRAPLRAAYVHARPSYGVGSQFSFVGDAWALLSHGDAHDARERLNTFRGELAAGRTEFAVTTGNASQIIGPGYSPLVAGGDPDQPLRALCTVLPLGSPVPFGVPGAVTATGVGSHVEGTNPTAGTLTLGGGTVAPSGISGTFDVSRELADSANPAVDAVALSAMRESYAQQAEARIAAELTSVTAGSITSGQVPSGAQVAVTASGTVATDVPKMFARMVRLRRRRPAAAVATGAATFAEALSALDQATGDDTALWRPMGVPLNLSADLTASSGDTAVIATSPDSAWAWETPTREFAWEQVQGPAVIRLSLFGYFAAKVLRPVGVAALRVS